MGVERHVLDRIGPGLAVAEPFIEANGLNCDFRHDQPLKMSKGSIFNTLRTPT